MIYGVTASGFVCKDYAATLTDLQNRIRANLGDDTDLSDTSWLGQMLKAFAYLLSVNWQLAESTYYSGYLESATGANLDAVVALLGISRNPSTKAIGTVTFSRSTAAPADIIIPSSTRVSTADGAIVYKTDAPVTLLQGNTAVDAAVTAQDAGAAGNVSSATVNTIVDPVSGIESVTNSASMTGGADTENDSALRTRVQTYSATTRATEDAILAALTALDGVTDAKLTEDTVNCSISITILGGVDAEITTALNENRAAGIAASWLRPTQVTVTVTTTVRKVAGYADATVQANINSALSDYFEVLQIGDDVTYSAILQAVLNTEGVAGVNICSAQDDATTPNVIDALGESLAIADTETAVGGTHAITVVA